MLMKMWRERHFLLLVLMGVRMITAFLEGNLDQWLYLVLVPFLKSSFYPAVLLLGIYPKEITRDTSKDVLFIIVQHSVYNIQP